MMSCDLKYLCTVIGNLTGLPIRMYQNKELVFYHSISKLAVDPIKLCLDNILAIESHVGYYVTKFFDYYGVVKNKNVMLVIGPSRQISGSEQGLRELALQIDVPSVDTDDFVLAMKNMVNLPLDSVFQILFAMNHIINNGEKLGLNDVKLYDSTQQQLIEKLQNTVLKNIDTQNVSPSEAHNNSYELEQNLMDIVRHGDTASLKQWIKNAPAVRGGTIAYEGLRQAKNTFVVSTTLVCRNAIRGGMDVQDSLNLSDSYIRQCELLKDTAEITNLQYIMVLDYTERVERIRRGKQPTKLAMDVTHYVLHHLSEPIKSEDIATALFMSRSRLSTKFKKETGVNLADYILKEKAIEAKRLLRYSNKSIIAISEYLGFSSPSHFTNIFKKYIGLTPTEYREHKQ